MEEIKIVGDGEIVIGPNVNELVSYKMSSQLVLDGGGLQSVLQAIRTPGELEKQARLAQEWVRVAIAAVRGARDYGRVPWETDEEIAGEILRQLKVRLDAKKQERL